MFEQESYVLDDTVSVLDQAALLLSIADIARSEIISCPSILQDFENTDANTCWPVFPILKINNGERNTEPLDTIQDTASVKLNILARPNDSRGEFTRLRTISIDSPLPLKTCVTDESTTPFVRSVSPASKEYEIASISADKRKHRYKRLRLLAKRCGTKTLEKFRLVSPGADSELAHRLSFSSKKLQGNPPKGISLKKIARRKFSWKNYPELEEFLVSNREEYLEHSALNYTIKQKQYNNRLTERLLELATSNGYMFDDEFTFVTVRDRIRCYYKSFVQSAKKRGVLMGYAARKASHVLEDEDP